jgi:hypothetical protein
VVRVAPNVKKVSIYLHDWLEICKFAAEKKKKVLK